MVVGAVKEGLGVDLFKLLQAADPFEIDALELFVDRLELLLLAVLPQPVGHFTLQKLARVGRKDHRAFETFILLQKAFDRAGDRCLLRRVDRSLRFQ